MNIMARERQGPFPIEGAETRLRRDVIEGLSAHPKYLLPKYFYDRRGSQLFDLICTSEEYYPTRTESGILARHAKEMLSRITDPLTLIELGSGSSIKTRYLLEAGSSIRSYLPIDISRQHLLDSTAALAAQFPQLAMQPLAADYTELEHLPRLANGTASLLFFPGSTLGNLDPQQSLGLLRRLHRLISGRGYLLLGVDLLKDRGVLEAAYNDKRGYTAAFNLNILQHINRALAANFDLSAFEHEAFFNAEVKRIEMHLRSRRDQSVLVAGRKFSFAAGESIHTESSYKFDLETFPSFVKGAGWNWQASWTDPAHYFGVVLLKAARS